MKWFWLTLYVTAHLAVLGYTYAHFDGARNSDIEDFLIYAGGALAFPISIPVAILWGLVLKMLFEATAFEQPVTLIHLLTVWATFCGAGVYQWFVVGSRNSLGCNFRLGVELVADQAAIFSSWRMAA